MARCQPYDRSTHPGCTRHTGSGESNDERGLKHRDEKATRTVPISSELVVILREHIGRYGVAGDGRLFRTWTGQTFPGSTVSMVWKQAWSYAFTPDQVASPPARRPYDLWHAAVWLWLNAGVHVPEVAGSGVDVLLKVYAKCIDGQHEVANKPILEVLTA
ncbi:hypothetical protein [Streptosporangium amethystogenes]|uniref:hypothetical protein n=1 Tax=Streptosporangium amethystogenes TaxID=2002 RepID=UPI0006912DD8|nr:hypothetical protein [Streptosporangium amethystogenes]